MSFLKSVTNFVVYGADGNLDVDNTVENIRKAVIADLEAKGVKDQEIETTLNDVFARLNVDVYPTPQVISIAAATMVGSDLTRMAEVSDEIRDYLDRTNKFVSVRGRKGGLKKL